MLTVKENEILKTVYNHPKYTAFKLASISNTTYSYTYKVINKLIDKGIMTTNRNNKQRCKTIVLTRLGEIIAESLCVYEQNLRRTRNVYSQGKKLK